MSATKLSATDLTRDVLFPEQCTFVLWFSILTFSVFVYLLARGSWWPAMCPLAICITSVVYWGWSPQFSSWTRTIDVSVVATSCLVALFLSFFSSTGACCWVFMVLALLFYVQSHVVAAPAYDLTNSLTMAARKDILWGATYAHCLVYVCGALACLFLFTGDIRMA